MKILKSTHTVGGSNKVCGFCKEFKYRSQRQRNKHTNKCKK